MDGFMKWNCYDLAEQMEVFENCEREFSSYNEELTSLTRKIDEQYIEQIEKIRKLQSDLIEIISRLKAESSALDQGIDIYYAAEIQALRQVEALPKTVGSAVISKAAAATGNVIMEDWLAALAFRQDQ